MTSGIPARSAGPLLDSLTRPWREARAQRLRGRARYLSTVGARGAGDWHRQRAQALRARGPHARALACGESTFERVCRCCGVVREVTQRCGTRLTCGDCYKRAHRRLRARVLDAVRAHEGPERRRGRRATLVTLTMRASADLGETAAALTRAWARWRAWLAKRGVRGVRFCRVVEIADGQGGRHLHAHVVVWLPFVPYDAAGEAWALATRGAADANGIDFKRISTRGDRKDAAALYATKAAGLYAAKAVGRHACLSSETQTDVDPVDVLRLADYWTATYGRRLYSASVRFWTERVIACPDCSEHAMRKAPLFLCRRPERPCASPHAATAPPVRTCAEAAE